MVSLSSVFLESSCRKILLGSKNKVLWAVEQPCSEHLRGFTHLCYEGFPFKHEIQNLLSETSFVLWVGVFWRNNGQCQKGCFSKQTIQLVSSCLALITINGIWLQLVDAKKFPGVIVLVTLAHGLLSSVFLRIASLFHVHLLCPSTSHYYEFCQTIPVPPHSMPTPSFFQIWLQILFLLA